MRLRRLDLLRYGCFTDRSFELPVGGVDFHVVFGPNEAGKSTALSAIEDLLFGVETKSPYNFLHDYPNMRIGAVLESKKKSLEFVRRKGLKDTLLNTDGSRFSGGEAALRPFLAGADRSFFERMFSLDHVRLEKGGQEILEAKDEIGQILFSAGIGIVGLRNQLTVLSREADELWAPKKAGHRKYYQAHEKLEDAKKDLRQQTLTVNKWQELKRNRDTDEEAYAKIESEFEEVLTRRKKFERIRRVYHDIRRKAELEKDIAELGTVDRLPEDALQVINESERKERDAAIRINTLSDQLDKAHEECKALTYDEHLVLRSDDIRQLHDRRSRILGEKDDLPKRQAELDVAEAELCDLATELEWEEEEVGELISRIPARAKLSAVRSLHAQHGELAADVKNKSVTLEDEKVQRDELQKHLGAMRETTDVSRLEAVIEVVRKSGDVTGRVRSADQQVKDAQKHIDRLLSFLHPRITSARDAIEIHTPTRMSVQDHRDKVQDWERRSRGMIQERSGVEQKLAQDRELLQNATRDEQVITMDKLRESRGDRDTLWRLVKRKHIENAPISEEETHRYADVLNDLAAVFESAIRAADGLADQRFDKAEAVGQLAERSRNVENQENNLARLRKQQEAFTQEGGQLNADWHALWDKAPFNPLDPDAMLDWLKTRDELREAIRRRAETEGALEIQKREEREANEVLLNELSSLGTDRATLEDETLPVILERADSVLRKYEREAAIKASLEKSLQEASGSIERRCRELTRAEQEWSRWQEKWFTALTGLGLTADSNPDTVPVQIDIIEKMREKAVQINDLRHQRIDKINRDIVNFESDVAATVSKWASDLAGKDPDDAVLEIENRLRESQRRRDLRERKIKEIEEIENKIHAWEADRQEARDSVNHLKDAAGADTSEQLRIAVNKSDSLRALQGKLDTILQRLDRQGDGLTTAQLAVECDAIDIDQIAAKEVTADDELKTLHGQLTDAAETRLQSRNAFAAIGGDAAAARAEATRQEALAEIREVSERYVRVRTSAMLLQWAIDRYRREKQAPLLRRAGELFSRLTGGSFKSLQVNYDEQDQPHLTGVRPDREIVHVPGMSRGTEDQLYLALRVASIEDYLDRADALPFVADDLFINFDNDRAGAGFKVLGELSKKTQVLFFTHHFHLLDVARETLGDPISIVKLNE